MRIFLLLIILSAACSLQAKAQFLHAYGATLGFTRSNQVFYYNDSQLREGMRYRTGFNGSLFLEFLDHDVFTWVSEIQFNQFGSRWTDEEGDVFSRHRLNYGSFNNFLKARTEGIDMNLYALAGPRVKYLISSNEPGFSDLAFAFSGGIGCDITYWDPIIFFAEIQYIQGVFGSSDLLPVQNRAFEFRIGIKKLFEGSAYCPPALVVVGF